MTHKFKQSKIWIYIPVGICTWPRAETSFVSVQEYSTLLCEECFIEDDDVKSGDEVIIELEFLKEQEKKFKKPYFTFYIFYVLILI